MTSAYQTINHSVKSYNASEPKAKVDVKTLIIPIGILNAWNLEYNTPSIICLSMPEGLGVPNRNMLKNDDRLPIR